MKVKKETNLAKYGFKYNETAEWFEIQLPDQKNWGNELVGSTLVVDNDQVIKLYVTNQECNARINDEMESNDDIEELFYMNLEVDHLFEIPTVILKLILNDEIIIEDEQNNVA